MLGDVIRRVTFLLTMAQIGSAQCAWDRNIRFMGNWASEERWVKQAYYFVRLVTSLNRFINSKHKFEDVCHASEKYIAQPWTSLSILRKNTRMRHVSE
jgi:hypothetical protein